MNHAIQLMSQRPAMKYGTLFEIRPTGDMSEIIQQNEQRRRSSPHDEEDPRISIAKSTSVLINSR
jgi:hypothetical protein